MKKLLLLLALITLPQLAQAQKLDLLCQLETEFVTGHAELTTDQLNQLGADCEGPIRHALAWGDGVLGRGYTNFEEWKGCTNYSGRTEPMRFWCNEEKEEPLAVRRIFNGYSFLVNDLRFDPERFIYIGTAGENKKTIKFFRIPKGMTEEEVRQIVQEEHEHLHREHMQILEELARAEEQRRALRDQNEDLAADHDSIRMDIQQWWSLRNSRWEIIIPADVIVEEEFGIGIGKKWSRLGLYGLVSISKTEELFLLDRGAPGTDGATLFGPRLGGRGFLTYTFLRNHAWRTISFELSLLATAGYRYWNFEALHKGLEDHWIGTFRLGGGLQADLFITKHLGFRVAGYPEYHINSGVNIAPGWPSKAVKWDLVPMLVLRN